MLRTTCLAFLSCCLAACSGQSPQEAAGSVRDGLTSVGTTVQNIGASPRLEQAGETAKSALITTGEVATAGVDTAKEALTTVGETTVAVGEVAGSTLTAIGSTVIAAKAVLSEPAPEGAAPQSAEPQQAQVYRAPPVESD
jgi:hypothetical protein